MGLLLTDREGRRQPQWFGELEYFQQTLDLLMGFLSGTWVKDLRGEKNTGLLRQSSSCGFSSEGLGEVALGGS